MSGNCTYLTAAATASFYIGTLLSQTVKNDCYANFED